MKIKSDPGDYFELENVDDEDLGDFLAKIERSHGIKFESSDFDKVNTYGELCDLLMSKYEGCEESTDCTTQQAFYKLRAAIGSSLLLDKKYLIKAETRMDAVIVRKNRIKEVKKLKKKLGIDLKFLCPPDWFSWVTFTLFLISLIAFFFSWKIAVGGLLLFVFMLKLGDLFGKEFIHDTVGGFTTEMTRYHYRLSRRNFNTINKVEMKKLLDEMIANEFYLDQTNLTRETKFSWAK